MDKMSLSEWIVETHPETVIDIVEWEKDPNRFAPCTAWVRRYSEKHELDYVVCHNETYKTMVEEYGAYLKGMQAAEKIEARKTQYS